VFQPGGVPLADVLFSEEGWQWLGSVLVIDQLGYVCVQLDPLLAGEECRVAVGGLPQERAGIAAFGPCWR